MNRLMILSLLTSFFCAAQALAEPATIEPTAEAKEQTPAEAEATKADAAEAKPWRTLFNGRDLTGWKSTNFGGEGEVSVNADDKSLVLAMGSSLTGVTWSPTKDTAAIPTNNYEIELQARRVEGGDFFCGLTFPYHDTHASLVLGGWGGGVIGISSIDHYDASENETTTFHNFQKNQWYKVRLRITEGRFEAWIDGKSFVDIEVADSTIGVRAEVELSRPLGIASFCTTAELRNIVLREFTPPAENSKKAK